MFCCRYASDAWQEASFFSSLFRSFTPTRVGYELVVTTVEGAGGQGASRDVFLLHACVGAGESRALALNELAVRARLAHVSLLVRGSAIGASSALGAGLRVRTRTLVPLCVSVRTR